MKDKSEVEIVDLVLKLREKLVSFPPVLLHSFLSVCISVAGRDQGHGSHLLLRKLCSCSLIWSTGKWDSLETLVFAYKRIQSS